MAMQKQQRMILLIGIILAVVAGAMVYVYLEQQRATLTEAARKRLAVERANQSAVLVALKDIPKDTAIEADALEVRVVPNQYVQPQAASTLDKVAGMRAAAPIYKGEQITLTKLVSVAAPKEATAAAGTLAMVTPIGRRAITVQVDSIASVGGMIRPGDYVDVIAILPIPVTTSEGKTAAQLTTVPLFQNIQVLAVGQDIAGAQTQEAGRYQKEAQKQTASGGPITLAFTSQEASFLTFIMEQEGKIRFMLRSPADATIEPVQPASWEALFRYMSPPAPGASEEAAIEKKPKEVEIYRGTKKEVMPLSLKKDAK